MRLVLVVAALQAAVDELGEGSGTVQGSYVIACVNRVYTLQLSVDMCETL